MLTGIVVALPEETDTLTTRKMAKGSRIFITDSLLVVCSGTGPENARTAAEELITQGANRLLSWGCAAGLNPTLKPGDLTLTNTLIDTGLARIELNSSWHTKTLDLLSAHLNVHTGTLAESKNVIATSELKKQLRAKTAADVLDMESVAIAKVAKQHNLPFLAIRVVADPVNMDLPKAVTHALNSKGDVILSGLLSYLMLHPSELPGLIKLGRYFNAAKMKLKLVTKHLNAIGNLE